MQSDNLCFPECKSTSKNQMVLLGRVAHPIEPDNHTSKEKGHCLPNQTFFFPTCQVRVVRFYVSLFSRTPSPSPAPPPPPVVLLLVGSQLRSCEFSVACWTPTEILRVQCGVPDPNRDPASSVWRAGPQPRSCEFSVAARTPTAIMRVQCGGPDPNRDPVSSVWRAGPQVLCQKICQKE